MELERRHSRDGRARAAPAGPRVPGRALCLPGPAPPAGDCDPQREHQQDRGGPPRGGLHRQRQHGLDIGGGFRTRRALRPHGGGEAPRDRGRPRRARLRRRGGPVRGLTAPLSRGWVQPGARLRTVTGPLPRGELQPPREHLRARQPGRHRPSKSGRVQLDAAGVRGVRPGRGNARRYFSL